jgi:hypothetical protein
MKFMIDDCAFVEDKMNSFSALKIDLLNGSVNDQPLEKTRLNR